MKKLLSTLALMALMLVPWQASAVTDTLLVADGTTTNRYLPIYGYYVDATGGQHNQVIYPADMLGDMEGMNITALSFYLSQVASAAWNTTVTISMAEVDDTSLASGLLEADLTQVWQGNATGMDAVWEIEFINAYAYGGGNLLVDITCTKATYKDTYFYGIESTGKSRYSYNTTNTVQNFIPKTKFTYTDEAFCFTPTNLIVSDTTTNGATLTWSPGGSETAWIVWDGTDTYETTDTFYTFTTLEPATTYTVGVMADCGNQNTSTVLAATFTTECENGSCELNATLTGYMYTSSYNNSAIDVYQNEALRGSLTTTNTTVSVCKGLPVELRHRSTSTSSYTSGTAVVINGAGETVFNATFTAAEHSTGDVLATLEEACPSCFVPTNVEVSNINENGFSLSWEPVGEEEAWQITLIDVTGSNIYNTTTTSITFDELNPETEYTVELRADCGNDGLSGAATTTAATPAAGFVPATAPYQTGFEADEEEIAFWQFVNGTNNVWVINTLDDNGMLYISNDDSASYAYTISGVNVSYATRLMQIDEAGLYHFQFDYKGQGESNYDYMRAWVAPASAELTANKLPNGNTSTSGYTTTTPTGWIDLGGKMNQKDNWTHVAKTIELAAGDYKLVLMWCNDNGGGSQPPSAVDNLEFDQLTEVTINAHAADETMGSVEGAGSYPYGSEVTLTAVPASDNFYFTHWSTGDSTANLIVTADLEAMTAEYIAYFEANTVTVNAVANNEEAGMVEGAGDYSNGDSVVLNAVANEGWHFTQWSDGITDNPRVINNVVANVNLTALFVHPYGVVEEMAIDFEEDASEFFDFENGACTNRWVIGNKNADDHALFISNDGGQNNTYTNNLYAAVYAYMTVTLEEGLYDYSFDWSCNGESSYDFMRVALVPANVTLTASNTTTQPTGWSNNTLPAGSIALDGNTYLSKKSDVQTQSGNFEMAEAGDYKLVFYWRNDGSTGSNPAGLIDNIFMALNNEPIAINAYGAEERGEVEFDEEEYFYGDSAVLTAVPYDNYIFSSWNTGDTTPSIGIRVGSATLEAEYIAYFLPAYPTLTVEYEPDFGEVLGLEDGMVSVANGGSVTIEAVPTDGAFFGGWSDGNHDNPRTITLTDDMLLGCIFAEPTDEVMFDFENGDGDLWTLENGTCANTWVVGTVMDATDTATTTVLMISNNGVDNSYNVNNPSSVFAYYPVNLKVGIYAYSFDWKANGENNYDYLRAALVPADIELAASVNNIPTGWGTNALPAGAISLDGNSQLNGVSGWQSVEGSLELTQGGMYNLVFYWRNDNSGGDQTPALVDNISFANTHAMRWVNGTPQDGSRGEVAGSGEYEYGEHVSLIAMPYEGYMLKYWVREQDTLYGDTITVVAGDPTPYIAYLYPTTVTVAIDYYDSNLVSAVDHYNIVLTSDGQHAYPGGETVEFTVTATEGYEVSILIWDMNGHWVGGSDFNTTVSYSFVAEENIRVWFDLQPMPVNVYVEVNNTEGAIALGEGTYNYGSEFDIYTIVESGYQFMGWADDPTAGNMRTVTVTHDTTFTALVEPIICLPDTEFVHDTTIINDTLYVEVEVHDTTLVEIEIHDTTLVTQIDTVTLTEYITDTVTVTETVTDTVTLIDTAYVEVAIHDTTLIEVEVHDTTLVEVEVHDTTLVEVEVHDTTLVEVEVHDTSYVEVVVFDTVVETEYVNVLVHDTMYVNRYIYDSLYFYDTTYVHDTMIVNNIIRDTTYVTVNDSIIETLVDTMYVYVNDTTQIYNIVHDTNYVYIHDTTVVTNYDTLTVTNTVVDSIILNNYIHDTTLVEVPVHDTTLVEVTVFDTVIMTEYVNVLVHDTMYVNRYIYDSLFFYDTTYVHDTSYIYQWMFDTTYVTVNDSIIETLIDTMYVYVNDTTQIYNFVHDTTYVFVHDTTVVTNYDTLTVVNTVVDSVILNNYIHDTTVVTETVFDTVTNTEYVYDTVTNTEYVYDTVTNTVYDTVTNTVYDTVTNTEYVYDTVTVTETDTVTVMQTDTVTVTEIDTVTVTETDTLWMTDTLVITIHDTVYVHDTIYVGIGDEAVATNVKLYQRDGQIVVEGAEGARVMLYDAVGRQLATKTDEYDVLRFDVPATGAYLIKVGNAPARRIVVVR